MNILHISTHTKGGAAQAAIRLHEGLLRLGLGSALLTLFPSEREINFHQAFADLPLPLSQRLRNGLQYRQQTYLKRRILQNRNNDTSKFSFPFSAYDITLHPLYQRANLINLHWTADFLDYASFFQKNTKPVVWSLHDMNPFTGGCHYAGDCRKYQATCSVCPQLEGSKKPTYSGENLTLKMQALSQHCGALSIVTPSRWLQKESVISTVLKNTPCYWIPYGLDSQIFRTDNKLVCRQALGLPSDRKMLLFVSDSIQDVRKGHAILQEALASLESHQDLFVCAVGKKGHATHDTLPFEYYELGPVNTEEQMSIVYAAADVFIVPSLEDNLPNTVLESLMCGTPVIGFPVGGIPDMIHPEINGLLSASVCAEALAETIQVFLNNPGLYSKEVIRADAVARYDLSVQATSYQHLYSQLLSNPSKGL